MRAFLVTLLLLLVVLVAADFGGKAYAEHQVAQALRENQQLAEDPSVSIDGFPFLTQFAAGKYRQADISAAKVDAPDLGPVSVSATLSDVALPASDVFAGKFDAFIAGEVTSTVRIPATTLATQVGVPDLTLAAGDSGPSSAVLTGTVSLAGLVSQVVSVKADLSVSGTSLVVKATDAALGAPGTNQTEVPSLVAPIVLGQLSRTIPVDQLPFDVPLTAVSVQGSDLVVEGAGNNVTVNAGR